MIAAPVAQSTTLRASPIKGESRRVTASEFVANVTGTNSSTMAFKTYHVNPGLDSTFPRLSYEAKMYEHYSLDACRVRYVPATTTATPGNVLISIDYDAADPVPDNEADAANVSDSVSGAVWSGLSTRLSAAGMRTQKWMMIRDQAVPGDLNLYDACQFHIGTVDNGTTNVVGKLYIDYTIVLQTPQIPRSYIPTNMLMLEPAADALVTSTPKVVTYGSITGSLSYEESAGTFTMPHGTYLFNGALTIRDDALEDLVSEVSFVIDGTPNLVSRSVGTLGGTYSLTHTLPFVYHVNCTGTTTLAITAKATGAAGNLSLDVAGSHISVMPI